MRQTSINIHDYIHYRYDGKWQVRFRRLFDTTTKGWAAVELIRHYCKKHRIRMQEFNENDWYDYYTRCDRHIVRMFEKKNTTSESEWRMAFSCDAPNKPGYAYANNH